MTTPEIAEAPASDPASELPTSAVDLDGLLDDIVEDLVASNDETDNDVALIDLLFGDDEQ